MQLFTFFSIKEVYQVSQGETFRCRNWPLQEQCSMMPTPSTLPTINHTHWTKDHFPVNSLSTTKTCLITFLNVQLFFVLLFLLDVRDYWTDLHVKAVVTPSGKTKQRRKQESCGYHRSQDRQSWVGEGAPIKFRKPAELSFCLDRFIALL